MRYARAPLRWLHGDKTVTELLQYVCASSACCVLPLLTSQPPGVQCSVRAPLQQRTTPRKRARGETADKKTLPTPNAASAAHTAPWRRAVAAVQACNKMRPLLRDGSRQRQSAALLQTPTSACRGFKFRMVGCATRLLRRCGPGLAACGPACDARLLHLHPLQSIHLPFQQLTKADMSAGMQDRKGLHLYAALSPNDVGRLLGQFCSCLLGGSRRSRDACSRLPWSIVRRPQTSDRLRGAGPTLHAAQGLPHRCRCPQLPRRGSTHALGAPR